MATVVLHTSPALHTLPAMQPGCLAAEALLRMGHVEFARAVDMSAAVVPYTKPMAKDKNAKPWPKPKRTQDTIAHLLAHIVPQREKLQQEEARLTGEQRVLKTAFTQVCEQYLDPVQLFITCGTPETWATTRAELSKHISLVRQTFLSNAVSTLDARRQEWSGLTEDKAQDKLRVACEALSGQLGEGQWMLGTAGPTSLDALVFGYLATVLYPPTAAHAPFAETILREFGNLVGYCERVRMKYFEVYSLSFYLRNTGDFHASPRHHTPAQHQRAGDLWCRLQGCAAAAFSMAFFGVVNYDFLKQALEILAEELEKEGVTSGE